MVVLVTKVRRPLLAGAVEADRTATVLNTLKQYVVVAEHDLCASAARQVEATRLDCAGFPISGTVMPASLVIMPAPAVSVKPSRWHRFEILGNGFEQCSPSVTIRVARHDLPAVMRSCGIVDTATYDAVLRPIHQDRCPRIEVSARVGHVGQKAGGFRVVARARCHYQRCHSSRPVPIPLLIDDSRNSLLLREDGEVCRTERDGVDQ